MVYNNKKKKLLQLNLFFFCNCSWVYIVYDNKTLIECLAQTFAFFRQKLTKKNNQNPPTQYNCI